MNHLYFFSFVQLYIFVQLSTESIKIFYSTVSIEVLNPNYLYNWQFKWTLAHTMLYLRSMDKRNLEGYIWLYNTQNWEMTSHFDKDWYV